MVGLNKKIHSSVVAYTLFCKYIQNENPIITIYVGIYQRPRSVDDPLALAEYRPQFQPTSGLAPNPAAGSRQSLHSLGSTGLTAAGLPLTASAPGANALLTAGIGSSGGAAGATLALAGAGGGVAALNSSYETQHTATPPLQRRLAKSFSVAPSSGQTKG